MLKNMPDNTKKANSLPLDNKKFTNNPKPNTPTQNALTQKASHDF